MVKFQDGRIIVHKCVRWPLVNHQRTARVLYLSPAGWFLPALENFAHGARGIASEAAASGECGRLENRSCHTPLAKRDPP